MKRTIIDTDRLGLPLATLVQSFLKEGFTATGIKNIRTTMSRGEVTDALVSTLGEVDEMTVAGNSLFIKGERGVVSGMVTEGECTMLYLDVVAEPSVKLEMDLILASSPYVRPRREGVYDISINHYYMNLKGEQRCHTHYRDTTDFTEIRDDFYSSVDVPLLMKMYSESSEANLILTGAPGTGKTCFVKKCLRELALSKKHDIDVVYVKDREILKRDEFWADLGYSSPDVIVLDDLDDELHPRTEGRNEIVNHMLSFSDGLFDTDTKILITTNQPNTRIDKALIRPGRCFDILAIPHLSRDDAKAVWTEGFEESGESFESTFPDQGEGTTVSQAALMSEYQRYLKETVAASYLRDESISIRKVVEATEDINHEEEAVSASN